MANQKAMIKSQSTDSDGLWALELMELSEKQMDLQERFAEIVDIWEKNALLSIEF